MRDDTRPVEYRKTKVSALQQLAAGGDTAAARELARRGIEASTAVDLTTLDYLGLRALVLAWRNGVMPEDRGRSRALAEQAQAELEVRYLVDVKLWTHGDPEPRQPPAAPWFNARPARCQGWTRPGGSTLYPSETDRQRAQFNATAREAWDRRR